MALIPDFRINTTNVICTDKMAFPFECLWYFTVTLQTFNMFKKSLKICDFVVAVRNLYSCIDMIEMVDI